MSSEQDRNDAIVPDGDCSPPSPRSTTAVYNESNADVCVNLDAVGEDVIDLSVDEKKQKPTEDPASTYVYGWCTERIHVLQRRVHGALQRNVGLIKRVFLGVFLLCFAVYFVFAVMHDADDSLLIILLTIFGVAITAFTLIKRHLGGSINNAICVPLDKLFVRPWWKYIRWATYAAIVTAVLVFLAVDVINDMRRLTSVCGMLLLIFLVFITSKNPSRVNWRPVIWGLGLQFLLGVTILRWTAGYTFFNFLGMQVKVFLDYADEGSKFVFGEDTYMEHPMAFKVFPIVIYFSAVISILYHWGLMQSVVCKIAWLMQFTMDTTAIESLNAATNIFIGMAESCVVLRPFIYRLTKSELHAVMTGGFATVAGSYIALLVEVGISSFLDLAAASRIDFFKILPHLDSGGMKASPQHLLSAAIMSAPAALAMAKLSFPETEQSHTKTEQDVYMDKTPARNVMEAASNGAIAAVKVVSSVAANLIAILGLIAFLDAAIAYLGSRVGFPQLNFQLICSYMFWPLAVIMGVDIEDANRVGSLLGTKVFVDEFVSFRQLQKMVENGEIAERSVVLATYACCGFGSIAAVGIYVGALISVAPERRGDISEVALRAVINGNLASFLTACIAGILYKGERTLIDTPSILNDATMYNVTSSVMSTYIPSV